MADTKEYIVDVHSVRVDFPSDVAPDSPIGQAMVLKALTDKVMAGYAIVENFEVDEFDE